ncbi:MAG: hypothetical protein R3B67_00300 [Phycisphaerales bacterium]
MTFGAVASLDGVCRPEDSSEIGSFIGTLDACVERADLVGKRLLDELSVSLVHPGTWAGDG